MCTAHVSPKNMIKNFFKKYSMSYLVPILLKECKFIRKIRLFEMIFCQLQAFTALGRGILIILFLSNFPQLLKNIKTSIEAKKTLCQ